MTTFILLVVVYIAVLAWVSYRASRDTSSENYLIAGRKQNWWQVAASKYAASVGAGWFLTYTGFAYTFGWPLGLVILGGLVGILVYAYWTVPRLRSGSAFYTQSDFVRVRTGSMIASKYLDGSVALVAILSLLIVITGAATLLDTFGFLAYESAVVFTVAVVVAYIVFAGYRAVMATDVLQGLLILVLTLIISGFVVIGAPPSYETVVETRDISTLGIIILMFFGFVSVFADPTRYQVSYAGQSAGIVTKGMVATLGPLVVTAVAIFFVASAVHEGNSGLEAAAVFPVALTEYLPATLIPVGFFVFLVA